MTENLFDELKRRKVFKVGAAYLIVAWLAVQAVSIGFPAFEAPPWALRIFILVALLGFPVAVVMAWVLEATPEGVRFDPVKKGTKRIVALAILLFWAAVGWYLLPMLRTEVAATGTAVDATYTPVGAASSRDLDVSDQSIAVLPFENLSADPDNAFFATGIQDEILTSLAKIGGLKVISRTSTIKYGAKPENLRQIARELGVANILEGSVQRAKDSVHVNVQLIDARTDEHRWAESYNRKLDDVFAVQADVARTIATALNARLTPTEQAALAKPPTTNPQAYEHYLRGLAIWLESPNYAREKVDLAIREMATAVQLDPDFTLAWTYLAFQDSWYYFTGFAPTKQRLDKALADVEHAEALDPNLPDVRTARATYLYYGLQDFKGALAVMRTVTRDRPNDVRAWYLTGLLERRLGRIDDAIAAFRRARDLGPNDYSTISELALTLVYWQRFDEALPTLDSSLDLQPGDTAIRGVQLHALWNTGGLPAGAKMLAALKQDSAPVTGLRALQAEFERDDARAAKLYAQAIAASTPDDSSPMVFSGYTPVRVDWQLRLAMIEQRRGDAASAASAARRYREVMADADKQLRTTTNPYVKAAWHAARGMALAGLGRKAEAVAEGEAAVASVPASKDGFEGPGWPGYLARIHARNGEGAEAAKVLRAVLAARVGIETAAVVRLDPVWDPVRADPDFVKLSSSK